jgi:hypothetical protein
MSTHEPAKCIPHLLANTTLLERLREPVTVFISEIQLPVPRKGYPGESRAAELRTRELSCTLDSPGGPGSDWVPKAGSSRPPPDVG